MVPEWSKGNDLRSFVRCTPGFKPLPWQFFLLRKEVYCFCWSRFFHSLPVINMRLCAPCQAVMNQDPLAVLIRRNMDGNSILCPSCRQQIFSENAAVQDGQKSFVFQNPANLQTLTCGSTFPSSFRVSLCALRGVGVAVAYQCVSVRAGGSVREVSQYL